MKPKFYPGMDCQTADGRKVEIYKVTSYFIDGLIEGDYTPRRWQPDGGCITGDKNRAYLIPAPRKVTLQGFYVTYYADGSRCSTTNSESYAKNEKPKGGYIRHIPAEDRDAND